MSDTFWISTMYVFRVRWRNMVISEDIHLHVNSGKRSSTSKCAIALHPLNINVYLQEVLEVEQTGEVDSVTMEAASQPRCAQADVRHKGSRSKRFCKCRIDHGSSTIFTFQLYPSKRNGMRDTSVEVTGSSWSGTSRTTPMTSTVSRREKWWRKHSTYGALKVLSRARRKFHFLLWRRIRRKTLTSIFCGPKASMATTTMWVLEVASKMASILPTCSLMGQMERSMRTITIGRRTFSRTRFFPGMRSRWTETYISTIRRLGKRMWTKSPRENASFHMSWPMKLDIPLDWVILGKGMLSCTRTTKMCHWTRLLWTSMTNAE